MHGYLAGASCQILALLGFMGKIAKNIHLTFGSYLHGDFK